MRSLSVRLLLSCFALITVPAIAHDVTLTGSQTFAALDGSSSDHDGTVNGVFTVNDGNLTVSGVVNCNDDATTSACSMAFNVSGNLTINAGGALYAENRSGSGTGGAITLTVGGNVALIGNAIVSSASNSSSGSKGGAITVNAGGNISLGTGSTIDAGSSNSASGAIAIVSQGIVSVEGNVLSGPSRTLISTRLSGGAALDGGTSNSVGGAITISSSTFVEPAILVGATANIVSQGADAGAGPVTIDGCGVQVRGLVAALARKDGAARVRIRSGKDLLVDGRDLGGTGARMGRVRADAPTGTALNKGVDIFAAETVDLFGPASGLFAITSLPGLHDSKSYGGVIRIVSLGDAVNGSGNLIDDGHSASGDTGGSVDIWAKADVSLNTAMIRAVGDFSTNNSNRGGGVIRVRSHSGDVIWTNGTGEVRPVGSNSNLPLNDQGSIVLIACGTITTTGSSFPVMGTATSVFPETHMGVCSPAAPSLPAGAAPLITCNTPPVANDTNASTNEDTTVTLTLSGTDADGDSLTFTIVSGPASGVLAPVISTGPTTATVDYTPNLNYNGGDSFVFRANDGNGGTDDATATITIAPVNDPPSFLAGPTVSVLEDSGAQTYTNWVTAISAGPGESGQTVTFSVNNNNNALFAVQPAVDASGTLTFTPAVNQFGSATITIVAQDNGGTANGGDDTSDAQTSTINVNGVNDEPSFSAGPSQTVNEDAGTQTVNPWATSISAGPSEGSQTLTFVTSNNNNALFSAQPAVAANGTLTYTPAANANGSATVTVFLTDDGGTASGGDDTSPSQTFTITVGAVNDEPSFTNGGTVTVLEDSGAYSGAWTTGISTGPADENGQNVVFSTSNDNNALFSVQPSVAPNGTLTFTPAANAYGSATVTISAQDNGGTANGGDDTSPSQTFVIDVTPVNDEPSFTSGGNVTVNEDSGAYSASWATGISAGTNESQSLTFNVANDNNALFAAQPSISASGVLSFTTAANANGSTTLTVFLTDDGGTANGGDDTSSSQTFTITVGAINDEPSFTGGGNVTVLEDSGAYSGAWATGISTGPADENGQTVAFSTSNDNNALFSVQPSVAPNGTLTFTPAANAYGSATVTISAQDNGGTANGGDDTSPSQTFVIDVTPVNDEPSFTSGGNVTVNEDSGAYSASWATGISAGTNESQSLTFTVANDNNALFAAQPSISASGVLSFATAANANGSATVTVFLTDDGGTANGGDATSSSQTFTITVSAVNDAPSFTSGGNVSVNEDSGTYSAAWASAISAGPADESGQAVSFAASNNNNSLFSVQPAVSPSGVLTFTVATSAFGSATVTVTLSDNGGTANGGVDTSASQMFTINVNTVNDEPSFTSGGNVSVNEDSGAYSAAWATGISAGPNESGQTLTFVVSNDNNALFASQPSITAGGVLTFTPAANASGIATVSVYLMDGGGTANGGDDTSPTQTFVIAVNAVNDEPVFTPGGNVSVLEDSASYSAAWATGISAGPSEGSQNVSFNVSNNNNALFSAQPAISPAGGLTFTVAPNATGSATVSVFLTDDGGTANGGDDTSATVTFTITVNQVNDAPSFTPGGDVTVNEDSGPYAASWATGISAGPNEGTQTVTFLVSNDNNALFLVQPSLTSSGILSFTSGVNAFGTATITVALQDNGGTANGGVDTSASTTFTITVNAVNDAPTANADSWSTFGNTELRVDLAGGLTPKVSAVTASGNGVRDNDSDPEGDPSVVSGIVGCADPSAPFDCTLGDGSKVSMLANGSFSYVSGPGASSGGFQYTVTDIPAFGSPTTSTGTVSITIQEMIWYVNGSTAPGGNGTSIAPFNDFASLNGPGGAGDVDGPNAYLFVHTSTVNGGIGLEAGQRFLGEGVGLIVNSYTLVTPGVKPNIVASGDAVSVTGVTGVEIAGLAISSATGNAIDVTSNPFQSPAGASIHDNTVVSAGLEGIDVNAGSLSGTNVILMNNVSIASSGNGVDVSSVGPTVISLTNGTVLSSGGTAIRIDGTTTGNLTISGFSNVSVSGNTAADGISITDVRFDGNPATAVFDVVAAGAITVGSTGNPVGGAGFVLGSVSGDLALGSLVSHASTNAARITGGGLFTGTAGMRVTSGGGVLSTGAGEALSVTNATIGAAHLSFTSISATGGVSGILLNNTDTAGGLKVLGSGSAGSGGTIHGTSTGVSLTNTTSTALAYMHLHDFSDFAIRGSSVNGFAMTNTTINGVNGNNAAADEGSVSFSQLTGSAAISNCSISGAVENNLTVINSSGTLNRLTISNTTFGPVATATGDDGVLVEGRSAAIVNVTVQNSFFTSARGDHFQLSLLDNASSDLVFTGNTVTNNHPSAVSGSGGLRLTGGGAGSNVAATFDISNNTIRDSRGTALGITKGAGAGTYSGTVNGNVIGVAGIADSGSAQGSGISVVHTESGSTTIAITNNQVYQYGNFGVFLQTGGSALIGSGTLKATVTGNTVANPGTLAFIKNGFHLNAGTLPGDAYQVCLTLGGAGALANAITGSGAGGGTDFRLRQRQATTVRLLGYAGANSDNAAVVSFVQANNGGSPTGTVANTVPTGGGYLGGFCP